MSKLAILGASGHGKVVADTAEQCGWNDMVFYDDAWPSLDGIAGMSWPIIGNSDALFQSLSQYQGVVVAIGNNATRHRLMHRLMREGAPLVSLIHPRAVVSRYVDIGPGTVVFAGVVVNAGASIGAGCILNTGCSVDHDCRLDQAVHISPGARLSGAVQVGQCSWVGVGACVRQQIVIGHDVTVGAGAIVVTDVADNVTVIGNPARLMPVKKIS